MDLETAAQQFYDYSLHIRGYSKATVKRYKYVIDFFVRHKQITCLEQITSDAIRALFLYGRMQRGWSTATYMVFFKSLSVFLAWCISQEYISQNPILDIEKPKLEKRLPPKLTKQQALKLLEVAANYPYSHHFIRTRNHALLSTIIFAGLRLNELLHLKYSDVDLENAVIFIRQGKGHKDRIVPITGILSMSLERYLQERRKLKKTCPEFFASFNRNMGYTVNGMKKFIQEICKAGGIKFTAHKLRHTFATLMLEGGCDIYSLSKMMGHSDIKTTTIYLAASAEHLRSQIMKHPLEHI